MLLLQSMKIQLISSSLLIIYEPFKNKPPQVKLIDFAHSIYNQKNVDSGVLKGLENLEKLLKQIHAPQAVSK